MRLIDADEFLKKLAVEPIVQEAMRKAFNHMPTIDVVRCKDCKHHDPEDRKCDCGALERAGCIFPVQDDYFCSLGERRED